MVSALTADPTIFTRMNKHALNLNMREFFGMRLGLLGISIQQMLGFTAPKELCNSNGVCKNLFLAFNSLSAVQSIKVIRIHRNVLSFIHIRRHCNWRLDDNVICT